MRPLRASEFGALSAALTPILRTGASHVGSSVLAACALTLLRHRTGRDTDDRVLGEIEQVVARCLAAGDEPTLGLSEPAPFGMDAVRGLRRQALAAAELAALDPALPRRCRWADLGPYRSLITADVLVDDALAPLDGAGASGRMLLETLEVFLDLAGDVRATSARLRLHRSSLYYRLDRIAALLGRDLGDGLVRLDVHLALKARRARRRTLR